MSLSTNVLSQDQGSTQTPSQEPQPAAQAQAAKAAPVDYSKEAFVVEQQHSRFRFENDGTGRRETAFRIRVQSEAGVQRWGQLRFGYNSANERVEIPKVQVIKADGSMVKAGADAVQDLSAPIQQIAPVYTDYREKHVTVPGLRPGDILECESVVVVHTAFAPGQFWTQYEFNSSSIILDEQLDIDIPSSRMIKLKTKPGRDPKITDENGRRTYHWASSHLEREEDVTAKDKEKKKKKKKADEFPDVQLTTFRSWDEVGRWYAALEKDRRQPSAAVRAQADVLTKGMNADLDKVQALYDYVSTNFRYVSLSLGTARYQPHAPDDVLHNKYGDCKDKHTLLASLLEAEGLHASAVLINSFRKIDPDVPSPAQFNHVISLVPLGKDEIWMDTTTEVAPFRLLSYSLRKKQGLVVPQDGTPHLEETPADPPVPDSELTELEGKVSESGNLEAKVRYTLRGDSELVIRALLRRVPAAQFQTFIDTFNKKIGLGGDASAPIIGDPAETRQPFTISYNVTKSNFLDWSKKKVELKLPLSSFNPIPVSADVDDTDDPDESSSEPFKIGPPNEHAYKIKLELAPRYTAHVPVPVNVERDYGLYQSTYKLEGNVFTAERRLVTHVGELPPARANDYRAFRRSVLADAAQFLTIESTVAETHSPPADMKPEELLNSGNEARKQGNYSLAITLLNRAVEATPKSKSAWNDLGLAYFDSRENELAINAFQKQIEIDPFHQFAYNNLGRVYLRQRKYSDAEKWFRKQIEINPLDKYAHANLGLMYVESHRYQDAIQELEQAASITPNDADPQVRLGEAYLNLDQNDKAIAAFDKAVQVSATPLIWNNIAYQLSLKKVHLDLARRYAESAIAATSASLRNLSLEQPTQRDLRSTSAMGLYWDTLGWVEFAEGNIDKALQYILPAWQLNQHADQADHLGQLYAKKGEKDKAAYFFALAMNARRPEPEIRARLAGQLGSDAGVDAMIEKYGNELQRLRTIALTGMKQETKASAEFLVLLSPGPNLNAQVDTVKFVSGDEALKPAADALRSAKYEQLFPTDTPIKILRRGKLTCPGSSSPCTFVLSLPDDVTSVD